ncbi:hypothetical protein [Bordetella bronchiseptica]|uniref:hypothetical protein n=1 Tax=Bordetella bronchiseptica TaxID=518 RepID=UPI00124941D8|nr:hypothetical protein [Bordetella bronchiseptica]KAB1444201.1 hypothetical protein F7D00_21320 [Bordetella bronchiseptica]KAB1569307.1 hypothetical protein F7890_21320 [Bordetella bronchiseptica]
MKVKNTSKRVIKLLNGKDKVTLVPGTDEAYDVSDSADVQAMIKAGELAEVYGKPGRKPRDEKDDNPLTVPQIKAALKEKGVEIPEGVTKRDDLLALLDAAGEDESA